MAAARRAGISAFTATVLPRTSGWCGCSGRPGFELRSSFDDGRHRGPLRPPAHARGRGRGRGPGPAGRGGGGAPAAGARVGGGHRRRPRPGQRRPRRAAQPARRTSSPAPSTRSTPRPTTWPGWPRRRPSRTSPGPVDLAVVVVPAAEVPAAIARLRPQGGQGGHRHLRRVRRVRARGRGAVRRGPAGRPPLRHPPARPELPGRDQHRPRGAAARHLRHPQRPAGAGGAAVGVGDDRRRAARPHRRGGPRAPRRSRPSATGPTCRPTTCSSTGPTTTAPSSSCSTSSRSATPASSAASPARCRGTKPIVAVKSGGAARAYPGDGDDAARHGWRRCWSQTGIIRVDTLAEQLHVARVLACQPLPAGNRVALVGNGGGSLALAADACVDAGLALAAARPGDVRGGGRRPASGAGCGPARSTSGSRPVRDDMDAGAGRRCSPTTASTACWWCAPRRPASRPRTLVAAIDRGPRGGAGQDAGGLRVRRAPDTGAWPWRGERRRAGVRLPRRRRLRPRPGQPLRPLAGRARGRGGRSPTAHARPRPGPDAGDAAPRGPAGAGRRRDGVAGARHRRPARRCPRRRGRRRGRGGGRGRPSWATRWRPRRSGGPGWPRPRPAGVALDVHDEAELRGRARPHGARRSGDGAWPVVVQPHGGARGSTWPSPWPTTRWSGLC